MPPRAANGKSAIQDLHSLYGLQLAAEMEKELGEPALGARYETLAARISANLKDKYWNENLPDCANYKPSRSAIKQALI